MLPTKGYFQDIECPYFDSLCGRPYCHFRHRKKPTENLDETEKPEVPAVPTYKPTPKSELANIHNNKSHIPISYVPDLAFRPNRTARQIPKFDNPTYKPTPLSILSSAIKRELSACDGENSEKTRAIKEIKENMANVAYNPVISLQETPEIDFEELSGEFSLIDEIIYDAHPEITLKEIPKKVNENVDKIEVSTEKPKETKAKTETSTNTDRKSKHSKSNSEKNTKNEEKHGEKNSDRHSKDRSSDKSVKSSSKDKHSSSKEKSISHSKSHKSSREKHRKEEKKDSKEKHTQKRSHKSSKDRDDDKHRDKEKPRDKDKKKHHNKSKSREREKERDKNRGRSSTSSKKHEKKDATSAESDDYESDRSAPMIADNFENNMSDVDFEEDEDETMMECFKIFQEYKPESIPAPPEEQAQLESKDNNSSGDTLFGKKRVAHSNVEGMLSTTKTVTKPKQLNTPGQILANRFKLAKLAQANKEQDNLMNEIKLATMKRPAPSLLEAARLQKIRKSHMPPPKPTHHSSKPTSLIDDIINGTAKAGGTAGTVRKIAPVQNVFSIQKAKARIDEMARKKAAATISKTTAQTPKGSRVAHVPEFSLSDIPDVLQADKSKLPVNVRTRFLTMIADECAKLYLTKEDAYTRALNEEFSCYEKCKVLTTYRNSAMLAVNRLRKEIQEREKSGLGPLDSGESSGSGKKGDYRGLKFYDNVKRWLLTEEELDIHGYPRESEIPGRAVIKNRKMPTSENLDENQKRCARCSKIYVVDDDGWPLYEEECVYHPLKKRTIRGEQTYLCCRTGDGTGCATSDTHVSEFSLAAELDGFQTTMEPEREDDPRSFAVYALDCEMCYTTRGLELTRVTIVDTDCKTVYESFVKPLNPIIDYNTRFSGITKEQMDKTSTSILQIQANILHLCNSKTILVGHSLESDMKALKIVHGSVIDTSVLFPHKMGLPHKRALRVLASEYLKKIIQNDVNGHDSAEDAVTCMELIKWKLKEELKVRGSK